MPTPPSPRITATARLHLCSSASSTSSSSSTAIDFAARPLAAILKPPTIASPRLASPAMASKSTNWGNYSRTLHSGSFLHHYLQSRLLLTVPTVPTVSTVLTVPTQITSDQTALPVLHQQSTSVMCV